MLNWGRFVSTKPATPRKPKNNLIASHEHIDRVPDGATAERDHHRRTSGDPAHLTDRHPTNVQRSSNVCNGS
ncbi:MAG TPA: hypothetical protein VKC17_07185, partial [Sphingomicrobium sp.]|nr:hypothetical protein [Sphingomicrobium sp.]